MTNGTAMGRRTRSRLSLLEKQDLERKNQSKDQHSDEEFGSESDYTSEEEGYSMDSDYDSDVLFVDERDLENISVDDNDVVLIDVDEDEDGDEKSKSSGETDRTKNTLKREKMYGLDYADENSVQGSRCVAQRTRSHFKPKPETSKLKLRGTFSHPLCLDEEEEESESISGQDDLSDDGGKTNHIRRKRKTSGSTGGISNYNIDDNHGVFFIDSCVSESDEEIISGDESEGLDAKQKAHEKGERRKKHKADPKGFDAIKILQDSLCGESEMPPQKFVSSSDEEVTQTMRNTFGNKESKPQEKSQGEKELDKLWNEMDECLCASGDESEGLNVKQKAQEKGERGKCTRKKHKADPKDFDAVKILQDSLSGESEMPPQIFASSSDEEGNSKVTETMRFTFGNKESKPPEKSQDEKELDKLWDEMDGCLCAGELDSDQVGWIIHTQGVNHVSDPEDEVSSTTSGKTKVSRATLCQRGEHDLILNEEIGLACKYCSHVSLEIKYCDPPFCKNPCRNSDRRDSCTSDNADHPVCNDFQLPISGCDDYSSGFGPYMSTGTVWDIIPRVKKTMFSHQCEAFEFLWMNLAGGIILEKLKKQLDFARASGCIISHAPGTGKTRLTIVFLQTFLELYPTCRPMIIAPSNMLLTWEEEFEKWKVGIPFHNLNKPEYSGKENAVAMSLLKQSGRNVKNSKLIRLVKLYSWRKDRSILGISYTLFKRLAGQSSKNKDIMKALLNLPGLLVLDEGHTPRNAHSLIFQALLEIKTKRRIILSGTPFQNNFVELYNTICLVKPKFDEKGGSRLFNSFSKARSDSEKDKILKDIRRIIKPLVHLYKGTILQDSLRGLREFVVTLKPTQSQNGILDNIQKTRKGHIQSKERSFELDYWESLTAVHPSILRIIIAEGKEKLGRELLNPEDGLKTKFLMELIRLSDLMNERVLVFSQFIDPLIFLCEQLKCHFSWTEGREMLQMHGNIGVKTRQAIMKTFNDPTNEVRVLLASIQACKEGISLVGASRVVLLDVVWNPSVERQAVSRAYRLGQKKVVYTYRLITSGTRDEHKCSRQAEKDQLSELVFFSSDGAHHRRNISSADLEDKLLEKIVHNENFRHMFEKVATNTRALL